MRGICLIIFLLVFYPGYSQKLRVAVAANAQFVAEALKDSYEKETGIQVQLIISSSGKLTAQIQQGAPFDIFLSADMKYPQALADKGLTVENPRIYGYGVLILWTLKNIDLSKGIETILVSDIKKIAIANPSIAPYGEAAVQVLKKNRLYETIKPKLVYGESVAQVNQYILSNVAELAFTAKSVVVDPAIKHKGKWIEVDKNLYSPIAQGVVILKSARNRGGVEAKKFYDFLFSDRAKRIFENYGYLVP